MLSVILEGTTSGRLVPIINDNKQFLKQVSGKKDFVDQELSKSTVNQVDKNRKVLLSVIDVINTIGKISVPLRRDWDD